MDNMIGGNMSTKTDADGHVKMTLQTMLNHRKYETSYKLKEKHVYFNGQRKLRKST